MIVSRLDPAQAVTLWDNFEPGVQEIYLQSGGTFGWAPADVYRAFKGKEAQACFVYDGEERVGWFIYRFMFEAATHRPYCHVWLAWAKPEYRGKVQQIMDEGFAWLKKEMKKTNVKYIEFDSNRVGWMKYGPKIGAIPHRMVFRAEV